MKIENTRELVLRAQGHARADHIKQGSYGESQTNGKTEFTGCAITCLAAPSRLSELKQWIKSARRETGWDTDAMEGYHDERFLLDELADEFGITYALARLVEVIFEGLPYHGGAIEFIPQFAKALVEGSSFTDAQVIAWAVRHGIDEPSTEGADMWELWDGYNYDTGVYEDSVDPEDLRDEFLAWVSERKPR